MGLMNENILSYNIAATPFNECIREIALWVDSGDQAKYCVCANPHSLEVARKDPDFDFAIRNADMIVPDGIGIVMASRILGGNIRERVTGMDIFMGLSAALNKEKGHRYFFLGSTEQNLMKIKEKMHTTFPNITVAGTYSPAFTPEFTAEDNDLMIAAINHAEPDVLWVGMTAPKQEKWISRNKDKISAKFIGAIGAVFDYLKSTAAKLTEGKIAVNFVLKLPEDVVKTQTITLNMTNAPYTEVVRYVAELASLNVQYQQYAVLVTPKVAVAPGAAPAVPATPDAN
jgi:N-acetylglucosaminyldiphosphoundecaprenol N-acetyl-beta-D-mannosaminyltransferase